MIYDSQTYLQSIDKVASSIKKEGGNILVTGATGLVGSYLIDVLNVANQKYGKNFEIYALGRSEQRIKKRFCLNESIHIVAQDICTSITIPKLDYIIHTASLADPKAYALYPVETLLTNVIGTKNVLDYCRTNNCRTIFTSSFEVNGNLNQDEYSEDEYGIIDLNRIRSCYPESKRTAELLLRAYYDEYDVDCIIARLPSVYGPTMQESDSKAHAQFIRNAISGDNIILKSRGTQKRTYCYVADIATGILTLLFSDISGEIYNIANRESIATIAEVARTIASIVGTEVKYECPDSVEQKGFSTPQNCVLRADKLEALGWKGHYSLKDGMEETINILFEMNKKV